VCEWDGVQTHCGFVDERGELIIPIEYTSVLDFDADITWVTRRTIDKQRRYHDDGRLLLDRAGKPLNENRYLGPSWAPRTHYDGAPVFVGDLACVALAGTYDVYAKHPERQSAWGYVNRAGQVVAWHPSKEWRAPANR